MSAQERYAKKTAKEFRRLAKSIRTLKGSPLEIKKTLLNLARVVNFLDTHIGVQEGTDSVRRTRNSCLRFLVKYATKEIELSDLVDKSERLFQRHYVNKRVERAQRSLINTIPKEIRFYLPPKMVVEIDKEGYIKKISDMFDNENNHLEKKINAQKEVISSLGEVKKKIYRDMDSKENWVRDSALVTAIIIETGIRPGNKKNRIIEGNREVKTFGAVSLKGSHLSFHGNKATLSFRGKKGTMNEALITDPVLVSELRKAKERSPQGFLFQDYDYDDLNKYFTAKFGDLNITDFRKLKATQEVYDALKREQIKLYKRIKSYLKDESEIAKEKLVLEIVKVLEQAHQKAQLALSHESSTTTKNSYINPQVLLSFLSNGEVTNDLESCILQGKTKLEFDVETFKAKALKTATQTTTLFKVLSDIRRGV